MSKKLPESVVCLGVPFRVTAVEAIGDEGEVGSMDGELRKIEVLESQDSRRQWTTLLHEYIHATFHVIGAGNKLDDTLEEMLVQSLEHSLEQLLRAHGRSFMDVLQEDHV